ncbi:hypothetical protein B9Z19DRAFT_1115395 [Tuber borchii]|uniref:Uncharacterized protein n=1 Tax=Tuber borchii TaxID=42251 RepID=A0A2T6ZPV9_TUBBO|nr:hypothetical protein B9Z19DRAFT_1115395 [Tuber borchii]
MSISKGCCLLRQIQPPHAPFGYTKGGKPHKRPLSNKKEGLCPVKDCQHSFRHCPNPKQVIWQHLGYYLSPMCAEVPFSPFRQAHVQMHQQMKAELANKRTEREKKKRQKESRKKWKAKNELNKGNNEVTEAAVEKLVEMWLKAE